MWTLYPNFMLCAVSFSFSFSQIEHIRIVFYMYHMKGKKKNEVNQKWPINGGTNIARTYRLKINFALGVTDQ